MRKRVKRGGRRRGVVNEGTWAISYGDMITLLLGFFVLFFSIDKPQSGNTLLSQSLLVALEDLDRELTGSGGKGGVDVDSEKVGEDVGQTTADKEGASSEETGVSQKVTNETLLTKVGKQFQDILSFIIPMQSSGTKSFKARTPAPVLKPVKHKLPFVDQPEGMVELDKLEAEAVKQDNKIFITFPKVSFFDSASVSLTQDGERVISKFIEAYLPFAGTMLLHIVGFADQRQVIKGAHRFQDNLELSVLRAVSAQRIVAKVGVPNTKTRLLGHGVNTQELPGENPQSTGESLALARKIMFIIEPRNAQ